LALFIFDEVKVFLDLLALVSFNFDHLIVLGHFNFDILLDPEHSATSRYRVILDSLSISFFRYYPLSQGLLLARELTTF
jgi:hypothetical protein